MDLGGQRKHVLDGVQIPYAKGKFIRERTCQGMPNDTLPCAKTAEPVEMLFGFWAQVGSRNHVLDFFDMGPDLSKSQTGSPPTEVP